jgi:hypothetical protein
VALRCRQFQGRLAVFAFLDIDIGLAGQQQLRGMSR